MLLSGPRVYAKMARDGVLPSILARLHGNHPRIAILGQAALCLVVIWISELRDLLEFVGVTLSLSSGAVVVGWFRQELRRAASIRVTHVCAAALFLAATAGIVIAALAMRPLSVLGTAILIVCGFLAHNWSGIRKQARPGVLSRDRESVVEGV
jgi:APA family basic amino acid/polyamine antiporter